MLDWTKKHWPLALIGAVFLAVVGALVWKRGQIVAENAGDQPTGALDPSTAALQVAQVEQLQTKAALDAAAALGQMSAYYNGANAAAYGTAQTMQAQNDLGATVGISGLPTVAAPTNEGRPTRTVPANGPTNEVGAGRRR